jgi:hypothetical protein
MAAEPTVMRGLLRLCACGAILLQVGSLGFSQSFNIDLNMTGGDPALGAGVPSASFGAAAGQQGVWNDIGGAIAIEIPLFGLTGQATDATIRKDADHPAGLGGFDFQGNTGDYALLLNDAEQVATLISGGTMTYTFAGLADGIYDLVTYAVHKAGAQVDTPVFMPEAIHSPTQIVTGPMPGNSFEFLITHSIHRFEIKGVDSVHVEITQPPGLEDAMNVNGFQIVAVPEMSPAIIGSFGAAMLLLRSIKRKRGKL